MICRAVFACVLLAVPAGAFASPAKPQASAPKPAKGPAPASGKKGSAKASPRSAPKPELFTSDGTLTRAGLATLAFSAAGRTEDKFESKDFGRKLIGRPFIFAQSLADADSETATDDAYWSYDKSAQRMTLSFRSNVSWLYVKFDSKKAGEYTGQNAFGVKARIKVYNETEAKLLPVGTTAFTNLTVTLDADPTEGRRLSQDVSLIVQGVVEPSSGDDVTSCSDSHAEATISDPIEVHTYSCYVSGRVTSVEFFDRKKGVTLAEWKPDADVKEIR